MIQILGIIFLLMSLWIIVLSAHLRTLNCKRDDSNQCICEILESGLLWSKVIFLGELIRADVETITTAYYSPYNIFNTSYGIILSASRLNFLFTLARSTSSKKQEAIVLRINSFINAPMQEYFTVREETRFSSCCSGAIAIAAGLFFFNQ